MLLSLRHTRKPVWLLCAKLQPLGLRFIASSPELKKQFGDTTGPDTVLKNAQELLLRFNLRKYSNQSGKIWDDSDWMNHNDSNAEAYRDLDITKLMPFPEFRNVATGPVWPANAFNLIWDKYYDSQTSKHVAQEQDQEWEQYTEEHGYNPVEYFTSEDYMELYNRDTIWKNYRRNHKGARSKQKTKKYCLLLGKTPDKGNPCPLCRDPKVLINYKNLVLFEQFVDPLSGDPYHTIMTGLCIRRHKQLAATLWLARDQGLLPEPSCDHVPITDVNYYRTDHLSVLPQ